MQVSGPQMSNELSFEKLFLRFTCKEISRRHTEINTNIRDTWINDIYVTTNYRTEAKETGILISFDSIWFRLWFLSHTNKCTDCTPQILTRLCQTGLFSPLVTVNFLVSWVLYGRIVIKFKKIPPFLGSSFSSKVNKVIQDSTGESKINNTSPGQPKRRAVLGHRLRGYRGESWLESYRVIGKVNTLK